MSACELCGEAAADRYLCERHTVRLAKQLADLPALYAEVGECLVPRRYGWGEIVATKAAAGPRSPLDEDVLDTVNWGRASEVTRLWRVDVQRVRWPQHAAPPPSGLSADCRWLGMELEWIVANYPAAGDLAAEVGDLERAARSIVGDPEPRRQRLGVCVAVTDDQGTVCGAVLSRLPGEPVRCRWCGTSYRTEQDLLLLQHYQPRQTA
ncbi:hypothetical protein [Streptomyces griseorubiginosus]|uniref:hypothetical protein n=1 Tax=Streptomyces griseorubiginosus TaxID=67304 RepID=UPI002E822A7A|nr:hypothetical protein [Streptomyces griseorubiginosus]WUB45304.1 hypothetical protein OHN19_18915 [Streptomyces griseorubiginosus]WUB53821.1 hypothetical protein OG942_18910 [Streptomyces griseorubiginosus]